MHISLHLSFSNSTPGITVIMQVSCWYLLPYKTWKLSIVVAIQMKSGQNPFSTWFCFILLHRVFHQKLTGLYPVCEGGLPFLQRDGLVLFQYWKVLNLSNLSVFITLQLVDFNWKSSLLPLLMYILTNQNTYFHFSFVHIFAKVRPTIIAKICWSVMTLCITPPILSYKLTNTWIVYKK